MPVSEPITTCQSARETAASPTPSRASFLLCPPDFYDTHFLFNHWLEYSDRVHRHLARHQWRSLVRALEMAGAEIEWLEPSPSSGAQVFTADLALVYAERQALLLHNDGPRGHVEPQTARRWFVEHGFSVEVMPPLYRADGGNLLRLHDGSFLVGLKPGATGRSERYIARLMRRLSGVSTLPVGLVLDRYLHLDMVVGRLGNKGYLVFEDAVFGGLPALANTPLGSVETIPISADDAAAFACNLVTVGDIVITGTISQELKRRITRLGFWVETLPLGEFHKAGGGAKCLTLPLAPI